jgi:hypothetical protein
MSARILTEHALESGNRLRTPCPPAPTCRPGRSRNGLSPFSPRQRVRLRSSYLIPAAAVVLSGWFGFAVGLAAEGAEALPPAPDQTTQGKPALLLSLGAAVAAVFLIWRLRRLERAVIPVKRRAAMRVSRRLAGTGFNLLSYTMQVVTLAVRTPIWLRHIPATERQHHEYSRHSCGRPVGGGRPGQQPLSE